MMDVRERNCRVFFDTQAWCRSTEKLRRSIRKSTQGARIYDTKEVSSLPSPILPDGAKRHFDYTKVEVTKERSFECAMRLAKEKPEARIGVLNFASAKNPGGGVKSGSIAQEESLCRCSTLYPVLSAPALNSFYSFHKALNNRMYTDSCIYTPDILVIKSDTREPERLEEEEWIKVDIITCAAPNLSVPRSGIEQEMPAPEKLLEIHTSRARKILSVAQENGIEIFVGGAFGCGAFHNEPSLVANAWRTALKEFDGVFEKAVFAVYARARETRNYDVFRELLLPTEGDAEQ